MKETVEDKTFRTNLGVHFEVTNNVNCNWFISIRIKYIFIKQKSKFSTLKFQLSWHTLFIAYNVEFYTIIMQSSGNCIMCNKYIKTSWKHCLTWNITVAVMILKNKLNWIRANLGRWKGHSPVIRKKISFRLKYGFTWRIILPQWLAHVWSWKKKRCIYYLSFIVNWLHNFYAIFLFWHIIFL
jgi:hypothetical protein